MAEVKQSAPIPVGYKPTIDRTSTRAGETLAWWDADKVRFVRGKPRKINGWQKAFPGQLLGVPRSMIIWNNLNGQQFLGIGTAWKYYAERGGSVVDVTPIRSGPTALTTDPITTSAAGSGVVTITHATHGAAVNDFVTISGATATDGLTTGQLNKEHQVISISTNTYTVDTGGVATSGSVTGGGAVVQATYQLTTGTDSASLGPGWGAGVWGRGTWNSEASTVVFGAQLRVWSQDTWGEDLVINPRGGKVYLYDSSAGGRATDISTLPGASDTPLRADQIIAAGDVRIMFAFGTNIIGTSTYDPMHYRWCDLENLANWTSTTTNAAGGQNLPIGSLFMQAVRTRQELVAFTDKAIYAIQLIGGEDVFSQRMVYETSIAGPKAAAAQNDNVYFMGLRDFYVYSGYVRSLNSPLLDYVFDNINKEQIWKVHCALNSLYNEVWWFYPSASSPEVDKYVIYNYQDGTWSIGSLVRTAWVDHAGSLQVPRAADASGYIYDHETGLDDGSTAPPTAISSYIEGSYVALGDGYRQGFLRSIWPDLTFNGSTSANPSANLVIKLIDKPVESVHSTTTSASARTSTSPVETITDRLDIGVRGRYGAFRIENNGLGDMWSLGVPKILITPDGRR